MVDMVATEQWVINKTYEKDGVVIVVEWECLRTTNGYTLPFGGESIVSVPSGSTSDQVVAAIMAEIGPSKLEEMRQFNSEQALYMQMKEGATVVDYTAP